jgi:hypothetical protein
LSLQDAGKKSKKISSSTVVRWRQLLYGGGILIRLRFSLGIMIGFLFTIKRGCGLQTSPLWLRFFHRKQGGVVSPGFLCRCGTANAVRKTDAVSMLHALYWRNNKTFAKL